MITEQDEIMKELRKHDLEDIIAMSFSNEETYLPLIENDDGSVQIDPRFTTHA